MAKDLEERNEQSQSGIAPLHILAETQATATATATAPVLASAMGIAFH